MGTVVQTRLDQETQSLLDRLVKEAGWTTSDVLRKGIKLVAASELPTPRRGLIGAGMFDSGISDLSTNKKYMEDFGKTRRPIGQAK